MIGLIILCVLCLTLWLVKRCIEVKCLSPPLMKGSLPLLGHAFILHGDSVRSTTCRFPHYVFLHRLRVPTGIVFFRLQKKEEHDLWKVIEQISRESLDAGGVVMLKMGLQPYYAVTDPDDAMTIANNCVNKHYSYNFAKRWLGNGLITASGSPWKRHRKLLSPAFAVQILLGFLDIFNVQSRKLRKKLDALAGCGSFDISHHLRQMALENIFLTAFGISAEEEPDLLQSYAHAVEIILYVVTHRFQNVWLHSDLVYSFSALKRQENEALRVINSMADVIIKKKKAAMLQTNKQAVVTFSEFKCKALLDLLLELSEEEALTDEEIREEIDTAVAAALDSTAWVLTYTLVLLGSHQEVQAKVFEELQEVFNKEDRDLNKYDLPKLVYLEAVIKESLRLYTTGPITLRTLDKDIKLKNYTLESGAHCILSAYGLHRHACWGPDRELFRPERWLEPGTQEHVYAGFSLGRRTCMGKTYAMISLKTALSHMLRRYKFMANVNDLQLKMDFILKPTTGHFVSIERRDLIK